MTMWLKQSTAITIKMGPFLDETDGRTAETGLTLSQADFRLSKNGGDMAQKNQASSATHDELGYYDVSLDATDTNTLGRLKIMVHESGALPVWADFMVLPANVWDSFFGADRLQVHADEITAGLITATAIADGAITAAKLADDAITATKIADNAITEIQNGLATAASITTLQTSVDDIPTNAELATSQASADDATLAAIAALNNLSAAQVNAEVDTALADVGLTTTVTGRMDAAISTRASQASVDDIPTNAELATSQAAADDATLAAIAALNNLSAAQVNAEVDAALADYDPPTKAELDAGLAAADDATLAVLAALNNISPAQVNAQVAAALATYDPPTRAEATSDANAILAAIDDIDGGGGGGGATAEEIWTNPIRTLTMTAAEVATVLAGNNLVIRRAATYANEWSGVAIPLTWAKLYFTFKSSKMEPDSRAIVQIVESNPGEGSDGLLYLNKGTAPAASAGSLTVDQGAGTVAVVIQDDATATLPEVLSGYYDLKVLLSDGSSQVLAEGQAIVTLISTETI